MNSFSSEFGIGPVFAAYGGNGSVTDKVPPDMKDLVSPYWNQFPPLDPIWNKILLLVLVVLGIVSWCGNGMVFYIFISTKALRTPANLLIINLAFSDFCMMLLNTPTMVINLYYETWVLGPLWCDMYSMFGSLFGCASIWSMCMMALDRYQVIVIGMSGRPMTMGLAFMKILFIWLMGTFWTLGPVVGWSRYVPEGNLTSCGIDYLSRKWNARSYLISYTIFVYYTPFFLICWAYYHILSTVCAHEKAMREQAKKMNVKSLRSQEDCDKSAEAKLAKVALTTISMWFCAWTPYMILNTLGLFKFEGLTPLMTIWGSMFAKTAAVYNPIVYGLSHPKYRIALKEKCPMCVFGDTEEKKPNNTDSQSQGTNAGGEEGA